MPSHQKGPLQYRRDSSYSVQWHPMCADTPQLPQEHMLLPGGMIARRKHARCQQQCWHAAVLATVHAAGKDVSTVHASQHAHGVV